MEECIFDLQPSQDGTDEKRRTVEGRESNATVRKQIMKEEARQLTSITEFVATV